MDSLLWALEFGANVPPYRIIAANMKTGQDRKTPICAYKAMIHCIRDHVEKRYEHIKKFVYKPGTS